MLLPSHLLLLLWVGTVNGFWPNHESGGIRKSDFTDADITELGALQAVAHFMEKNPLPGQSPAAPGELEHMVPLTVTRLFKAYYKADVSAKQFKRAIQEIVEGNNEVERLHSEDSSFYFHCEEIAKSATQLRVLRDSVISNLKGSVSLSALKTARLNAGKALHVLQKFYSNTNWVEMGKTTPYEYLLNPDSPVSPVAPGQKPTCRDCKKPSGGTYECKDNLLVSDLITSGYLLSETCSAKPQGKCGHGGKKDGTQDSSATGGINKETTDPELSPHHNLHKKAAFLAMDATRDFFVGTGFGLLDQVGKNAFQTFFNLESYSMTFVIDTTGSMGDDIEQVKTTCIDIIRKVVGSPDVPYNYILVPFNDPDVGPVFETKDVDEFQAKISALHVSGGGDCPEMSLSGLKTALQVSNPRSKIFTFTDAGPKDAHLIDEIKYLIDSTGSIVNYYLTGYCSSRKRRSTTEESRSYQNLYEDLAAYSGGYYVKTTKGELFRVLGMMELSLNAAPVTVAYSRLSGTRLDFPVDETLTEITVSVKSLHSSAFRVTVLQPSDVPLTSTQTVIDTVNHKVVKVSPIAQPGSWAVTVTPSGSYEVEVSGKSLLDVSYQIMEQHKEYLLPIQGRPVKGLNYTVSMIVMADYTDIELQSLILISDLGTRVGTIPLTQTTDVSGTPLATAMVSFAATTTLLSVEGLSPRKLPFSRVNTSPIKTESVQIVLMPGQSVRVPSGQRLEISVLVMNDGAATSFTFGVEDSMGFLQGFMPTESFIPAGGSVNLTATFMATLENSSFASSLATFKAKSLSASNYLNVPIIVISETVEEIDETPPVHKRLDFIMPCIGRLQEAPACSRYTWRMRFSAKDTHSAVTVRVNANPSGLSCSPRGTDGDREVICHYQSSCCLPYAEVLISDETGNTDSFTVDHRRPRPTAAGA